MIVSVYVLDTHTKSRMVPAPAYQEVITTGRTTTNVHVHRKKNKSEPPASNSDANRCSVGPSESPMTLSEPQRVPANRPLVVITNLGGFPFLARAIVSTSFAAAHF